MAELRRSLTRVLLIALMPAALAAPVAYAQEDSAAPFSGADHHRAGPSRQRVWRDGYCGERASIQAPDIMTYDRKTGSEVLVGDGASGRTSVTGLNRESGTTFHVDGDLNSRETASLCTANGQTGRDYSIRGDHGATVVSGEDTRTKRGFEVVQGADGRSTMREIGPHALACTRARLGLAAKAKAEVGDVSAAVGGRAGLTLDLGDC